MFALHTYVDMSLKTAVYNYKSFIASTVCLINSLVVLYGE